MHFKEKRLLQTIIIGFFLLLQVIGVSSVLAGEPVNDPLLQKAMETPGRQGAIYAQQAFAEFIKSNKPTTDYAVACVRIAIDNNAAIEAQAILDLWQQQHSITSESVDYARFIALEAGVRDLQNQYEAAIELYQQALELLSMKGGEQYEGDTYLGIALTYWHLRNYPKSLDCLDKAQSRAIKHMDELLRLKVLLNKGLIYSQLANYSQAIEYQLLANELAKKLNQAKIEATSLNHLGSIYLIIGQYDKAQQVLGEALALNRQLNNQQGIGECLRHMGQTYYAKGNAGEAIDCYTQSLAIQEAIGDTLMMSKLKVDMGQVAFKNNQYQQSVKYYSQAIDLLGVQCDFSLLSAIYYHLGETYLAMGNSTLALDYCNQSLEIARKIGEREQQSKCYNALSIIYEQKGNYPQALQSKNAYALLKDSILNSQTIEYMARMDAIYRSIQKENTIKSLKAENAMTTKSLDRQRIVGLAFLVIAVLLLGLSILMYFAYRYMRRASQKLKDVNLELAHLNTTKDKFFSIISHDLKSPINSILGFSEMLALHAETHSTESLIEYSHTVHNSTKRLYDLVDNLLLWSRTQVGSTPYRPERLDIGILSQNLISLLRMSAEEKDILLSGKIEAGLTAFADVNLFNTVMRNLISNAIKFSRVGGSITVTASSRKDDVLVAISDTGVGIENENLEKLFRIDTNISTTGTFNEKGSGLGLILCKEFVEINKGEIWAESEPGKGSTFYFTLPKS